MSAEPWTWERAQSFFDLADAPKELGRRVCDLCGTDVASDWLARKGPAKFSGVTCRDRYGFYLAIMRCDVCGLEFQQHPLTPDGLRAFYAGPYRALVSAWHGREINAQTLEPEQIDYAVRLAMEIGHDVPRPARLLDLGGSTGMVAHTVADLVEAGPVTVVEPSTAEAVAAIPRAHRVVVTAAEDFDPGAERFDLILLCQTVDHLRSISTVLRKVKGWLAPGGRFFVDAVDSSLIPEPVRYKVDHIYSLTPATMRAYLERAGFVAREVPAPSENHVAFLCEVKA